MFPYYSVESELELCRIIAALSQEPGVSQEVFSKAAHSTVYFAPSDARPYWPIPETRTTITYFSKELNQILGKGAEKIARAVYKLTDKDPEIMELVVLTPHEDSPPLSKMEFTCQQGLARKQIAPYVIEATPHLVLVERRFSLQDFMTRLGYRQYSDMQFTIAATAVLRVMRQHRHLLQGDTQAISTDITHNNIVFCKSHEAQIIDFGLVTTGNQLKAEDKQKALNQFRSSLLITPLPLLLAKFQALKALPPTDNNEATISTLLKQYAIDQDNDVHLTLFFNHINQQARPYSSEKITKPKDIFRILESLCLEPDLATQIESIFTDLFSYIQNDYHFHCTALILQRIYQHTLETELDPAQRDAAIAILLEFTQQHLTSTDKPSGRASSTSGATHTESTLFQPSSKGGEAEAQRVYATLEINRRRSYNHCT